MGAKTGMGNPFYKASNGGFFRRLWETEGFTLTEFRRETK